MTNRSFSVAARLVLLCLAVLLANGTGRAYAPLSEPDDALAHGWHRDASLLFDGPTATDDAPALIQVALRAPADLDRLAASHLPVYARLTDAAGQEYVLMLADSVERQALLDLGLAARILDADTSGAAYYLAYRMPGRPAPRWNAFGRLLLDDGAQVLLRLPTGQAEAAVEKLVQAGVRLSRVTFDPKPLYPSAQGALPAAITPDPLIQLMMSQVTPAAVYAYDGGLSGEWPVQIGGAPYTITTRHTYSGQPIQKATQYVGEHLANLGLGVEYHQWNGATYPNVIGTLTGTLNPANIFIISAHLDDMPSSGRAPGADDNASGAVAVLMAADILSQYNWGCTLRFAFWTGEEQGLLGSAAYAQRAHQRGENILGVLNLDMIAWNTPQSSPDIDLHAKSSLPQTLQLAQLFADVVDVYDLNLIPEIVPNGISASDHASFWNYGYTAILGIEDYSGSHDFNPYYHTSNDRLQYLDLAYFTDFVKASVGTFAHMSGCLVPGGLGYLDGHVTAASGGAPIEGAIVTAQDAEGHTLTATTDATGYYTRTLLSGVYTVTASAYWYLPSTVTGVVVASDTVTTRDFNLTAAPTYIVSGTVTEFGTGIPLSARVDFQGSPVTVWTNPATGFYSATLAQGSYTARVTAARHRPTSRAIVVNHDQTQNFALEPLPCVLLVDDDQNNPDVRAYYTDPLDALGVEYDVWNLATSGDPTAGDLLGYKMVVWFTGYPYSNVFNSNNEAAVSSYLDAGGNFFLSSQDYLYESHLTPFGQNYLHIGSYTSDQSQTTVTGANPYAGLGPYALSYPFINYSDVVNPNAQGMIAFTGNKGNAAVAYDGAAFNTVFLGFPFEAINLAGRTAVMSATLAFFGGCGPDYGWLTGQVTDAVSGQPLAGAQVVVMPPNLYTFTNPNGHYTFTLPAGVYDVTASAPGYISQTASVIVQSGSTTIQNLALQPVPIIVVEPRALQATLNVDEQLMQTVWLTNAGAAELTFTFYEITPALWLSETPISGTLVSGEGSLIAVTFDAMGLTPGDYYAFLDIESNDPDAPHVYIPVTLTVELPCSPVHDAAFTWTPVTPTVGMQIDLVGVASGTLPIAFVWEFGDGAVGSGERITHTFAAPGDYTVVMTASNCVSATGVVSHVITTGAPPIAAFAPAFYIAWPGQPVTFTNLSTGTPPLMHLWGFGDGAVSTDIHPIHTYTATDMYTVILTVTNAYGRDMVTGTVEVVEPPCPVFTPAVTLTLLTSGPIYTDTPALLAVVITRDNALPYTFTVDYADGTLPETGAGIQDSFELTHTFAATGVHQVEIIVGLDRCGELALVTDTLAVTVSERLVPCVEVTGVELSQVTPGPFYPGTPLTMTVSITPSDAIPYHYTVDYGDGITATAIGIESTLTLTHAFAAVQTYTVQLAVWNCSMTAPMTDTLEVTINPRPFNLIIYLPLVIK